jgi:VWFA-related protein
MSSPKYVASAFLVSALCISAVAAQQIPAPAQPNSSQIYLDVVVTPKSGAPVGGLKKQDFTVTDNNVAQPIATFEAVDGTQAPIEVVLVVDAVNTDFTRLAYEREQIDNFLKSNGGHLAHPVELAIFTDAGIQLQQAPSTDGNQLSASLDQSDIGLREVRRTSQFENQDRINLSLNALHSLLVKESQHPGRKLIFWISPGWPLLSGPRIDLDSKQQQLIYSQVVGISNALRQGDITLYSVDSAGAGESVQWEFYYQDFLKGVTKPSQVQLGNLALQVIAVQSGGLALSASNDTARPTRQIEKCMADTAAYYRISYNAPPTEHGDSQYHATDVKVSSPGLVARTRTGYYTGP